MDPIGLVQLRGVLGDIFGVEVVVGSRDQGFVIDFRLLVNWLPGEGVPGGLDFVDISVIFLLFGTHFLVVLFELLGGGEPGQKGEVRSHDYITYKIYL